MNEIQAAVGLLNLQKYKEEKERRRRIKAFYDENIGRINGIKIPKRPDNITNESFQYYPIIIEENFRISRNALYDNFRSQNIFVRKYFYPLCSDYECYKSLSSANSNELPVANDIKNKILCLPFHGNLVLDDLSRILDVLNESGNV
jgi:dTDP-4-amino-4,6-dideoxygalactose transaminase